MVVGGVNPWYQSFPKSVGGARSVAV